MGRVGDQLVWHERVPVVADEVTGAVDPDRLEIGPDVDPPADGARMTE